MIDIYFGLRLANVLLFLSSAWLLAANADAADKRQFIRLKIEDQSLGAPAKYGIERLTAALGEHQCRLDAEAPDSTMSTLVIGTYGGSNRIRQYVDGGTIQLSKQPEALAVKRLQENGQSLLVIAGYDDVGLMYALLDLMDGVAHAPDAANWFDSVAEISESPRNSMRRMRVLMHHAANEQDWYHSIEYWDWYIGMLATHRFNGLNLVYSHQSPYMAPMYAWHVEVDEFPNVRARGVTDEERRENLKVMRHIAKVCHERGIELTIGVWQHLPWFNSYLKTRPDQESLVEGLDHKNIGRYTYLALQKLLKECPGIARIQIRPNEESGIHPEDQTAFYRDNVMQAIKEAAPHVKLDLRTVGVLGATVKAAREADLDVRTSVKHYGEFMAQPYSPLQTITPGYSYNQFLQKPQPNPVYNELWVLGSHRVLLWGSEYYGREFGRNASFGGTIGFETDGPMAQKGFLKPTSPAWRFFNNPEDEYFNHEIERYWAFFRTMGRFGYNPDTPREVWLRPFVERFGEAAEPMAQAYESASRILSLVISSHVENPNNYTWPEISMGGVVSAYTALNGMDMGMFPSIDDQVEDELAGRVTGHIGPMRLASLYENIADQTERALADASAANGKLEESKEYRATAKDFQILAHLARYHAHRQREGYDMARFYRTGDASLLPMALQESEGAVDQWRQLVGIAEPHYYPHLQTGMIENGHWKDKTFLVETNPKIVRQAAEVLHTHGLFDWGFDFGPRATANEYKVFYFHKYANDFFHERRFVGVDPYRAFDPRVGYGFLELDHLHAAEHPLVSVVDSNSPSSRQNLSGNSPVPNGPLPLDFLTGDYVYSEQPIHFRMELPQDGYRFTFEFADRSARPRDHGPFDLRGGSGPDGRPLRRGIRVPAGETVVRQVDQHFRRDDWFPYGVFTLAPTEKNATAMISALTVHRQAPKVAHAPLRRLSPAAPCKLSLTITMPPEHIGRTNQLSAAPGDRLKEAMLHYRTDGSQSFQSVPLESADGFVFSATIEPDKLKGRWLEYAFLATDNTGRAQRLPDAATNELFRARLTEDANPPTVVHQPIHTCKAGQPLPIEVEVRDPDGVSVVRVHYRPLDETLLYESLVLERQGNRFSGKIPGAAIRPDFDFVYYLEAVDEGGTGCFFPDWTKTAPYIIVRTEP
ncbi:MAG: hypothetical protein WD468_07665 [Pirellulales bacterium]